MKRTPYYRCTVRTAPVSDAAADPGVRCFRPHHVLPAPGRGHGVDVECKVLIAELSGSESVIHFDLGGLTWVSLSHGVHAFKVGEVARFELDVARCLYFGPDGVRVAA
jgi:glycerol transport system ATP-binding protein